MRRKHWPSDAERVKVHGKLIPKNPPFIFSGVSSSCLFTPKKYSSKDKSMPMGDLPQICDQMEKFIEMDTLVYRHLLGKIR